ncbi:MAG: hypothetical protein V3V61_04080, partial [Gammaproteobacteria bacterium]
FGFLSFPPASLLHELHIIPWLVARTGESSEAPWTALFTILSIIGAGGFLSTGAINIFKTLVKKLQTNYAMNYGNAQEYVDEVLLRDLVAFLEDHPQGFSADEIPQHVKSLLSQIMTEIQHATTSSQTHQGEQADFSTLKESMEALSFSHNRSSMFHNPAIVAAVAEDGDSKDVLSHSQEDDPANRSSSRSSCCFM